MYFSDNPPALAEISAKNASVFGGGNRTIVLSDTILFYLKHLVVPSSPQLEGYVPNPQAALNEMVDSVFSSLLEIVPSPSVREGAQSIALDLPSSKPNPTGFFSSLTKRLTSHDLERGGTKLFVSSNPLVRCLSLNNAVCLLTNLLPRP